MSELESTFSLGDRVSHPRLGDGYLLGHKQDGTVVVLFDEKSTPDVLYPNMLVKIEEKGLGQQISASKKGVAAQ